MKARKKIKKPYRIDFDVNTRILIEVYEVSPDGSQVRTNEGWVSAYRDGVITQLPPHELGFMTKEQVEGAIISERELLKEKKLKLSASYIVAQKYPIKEWLRGE